MKMKKIEFQEVETNLDQKPESQEEKKKKRFSLKKKPFFIGAGFILLLAVFSVFFLVLPILSLRGKISALAEEAAKVFPLFEAQDFNGVINQIETIDDKLTEVGKDYRKLGWIKFLPYFGGFYKDGSQFLKAGQSLLAAADITAEALVPYYDLLGLDQKEDQDKEGEEELEPMTIEERLTLVLDTLDKISPQFDQISEKLLEAKTAVDQVNPSRYPEELFGKKIRVRILEAKTIIDSSTEVITEIQPIISYLKPLLGIPDEKVYFLLFQNDAELRPSGGFMTAYAFLSVHEGKFTPISSHDMYAADASFGNRVKAPEPILNYLPDVDYWHLRDMNLSPDFSESMKNFWENFEKIPGTKEVDGIIAVDTQVLVDILEILGQIGVPGWGNFSAENDPRCDCPQVFYELERYADQPVGTWRAERKGIIGPLMHSILANAMGSPRKKWPEFLNVFFTNLKGKHLLFYFFDEELQGAIETLNAGGRLKEFDGDYFHLNDCNFAGAKSNMYIQETVVQEIGQDSNGSLIKTITIDYRNPAPPSNCNLEKGELCLNGLYRNWFRVYVPQGSQLLESTGSEVEIKTYDELGKTVFEGFYGKTPTTALKPEGKLRLTFKYRLPFKMEKDSGFKILVQKQPGALDHEYEIKLGKEVRNFTLDSDKELQFAP
jgi:hypothetical protein